MSICVISKEVFGEYSVRDIQTNIAWTDNPYGNDYAIVPEELIEGVLKTNGFCDIELNNNGTEIISFTPRKLPEIPKEEPKPSTEERISALENAMLEMIGVVTE